LNFAFTQLGLSPRAAFLLLFGSLVGSYFNIPVAYLPGQQVVSSEVVDFFGMRYVVPLVAQWPGTLVAVNVGGALIPTCVSVYLLGKNRLWGQAAVATAILSAVCYWLSQPIQGLGIAEPVFVPALTAAIIAMILSRVHAAQLAYIGGSLGTLIGADLLNFGNIQGLGAPVASIGGAGTFDSIFLIGIVSVLIASLSQLWSRA
jgi:uncharacterized membrane protein